MKRTITYQEKSLLSYAEYGDKSGFPILIQHGLIASIDDHALFHQLIELGARLICAARPGYGESSPYEMNSIAEWGDIISALADELRLNEFDVLGMSSGAPYSYAIGYALPQPVRNIYIFSGVPALYDPTVLAHWPYPVTPDATLAALGKLAFELFFANVPTQELEKPAIQDSMRNNCFGPALDLKLRVLNWGFRLPQIPEQVYMRHSRFDTGIPVATAQRTAELLPNCKLEIIESDVHFSEQALDDFIGTVITPYYKK